MPVDIASLVTRLQNADGGFGPREGQPSESEPTALAALALGDAGARTWLAEHQRDDGSFATVVGPYVNDSTTGMAALALGPGAERERALDHLESSRAAHVESTAATPIDESAIGWAWTRGTASWVEPTARALWALRVARPSSTRVEDAANFLRDRECVGGGWNYGNREVLGVDLPPFVQTTAMSLVGLSGLDHDLEARGLGTLRRIWRDESAGGLSLATALAAFRTHGATSDARAVRIELEHLIADTGLLGDGVALAWAALALDAPMPGAAE
jgi:Prenyltransferase and squalene oxidase repeat